MPRVDAGWKALDLPKLAGLNIEELLDGIKGFKIILITSPSIITVRGNIRTLRVALSPGSILIPPESPLKGWIISRPDWVDGCYSASIGPPLEIYEGNDEVAGIVTSISLSDPLGSIVNGKRLVAWKPVIKENINIIATLKGIPVLWRKNNKIYISSIKDNELVKILDIIARLYNGCEGDEVSYPTRKSEEHRPLPSPPKGGVL